MQNSVARYVANVLRRKPGSNSALIALLLSSTAAVQAQPSRPATASDDAAALRGYRAASGLLNRGMYDLAADEYRQFLAAAPDHEKSDLARYGLAVCLVRSQKYDEALKSLREIALMREFAFRAESLALMGQCELFLGRAKAAIGPFEQLLTEHREHDLADDAAGMLAEARYQVGDFAEVSRVGERFAQSWPESAAFERVSLLAALAALATGDADQAIERLEGWLARYPKSADAARAWLALGQANTSKPRHAEAAEAYQKALASTDAGVKNAAALGLAAALRATNKRDEAAALIEPILKDTGASPVEQRRARFERGRLRLESEQYDAAQADFDAVEKAAADASALAAEAAYWAAKCSLRKGAFRDAEKRLSAAIDQYANSAVAAEFAYDRGVALHRGGDADRAAAALAEFLERYPKHALAPDALYLAALIAQQQRKYSDSDTLCRQFIEQHADSPLIAQTAFLAAENRFLDGDFGKAAEAFRAFYRAYPRDALRSRSGMRLGLALRQLGNLDEAAEVLTAVAPAADKDDALLPAMLALGDIAFERGEWKAAIAHLKRFIERAGKDSVGVDDALLKLGLSLEREKSYDDALRAFDELLATRPDCPHRLQALFERGQTLALLERGDAARAALERVLSEGSESRFVAPARQWLAALAASQRDFKSAAQQYKLALDAAPEAVSNVDAQYGRAAALLAMGDFPAAEASFRRFLESAGDSPRAADAMAQLAIALARQDRYAEALKVATSAEAHMDKIDARLQRSLAHEKAWCLRKSDHADEAAETYRRLLRDDATDATAAAGLAEIDAAEGRCAEALKTLAAFVTKDAPSMDASVRESVLYRFGACAHSTQKYAEAADVLEVFVQDRDSSPLLPSAAFFLGDSLLHLGKNEKAAEWLARAAAADDAAIAGPALLRLGEAWAALQRWNHSEKAFADYLDRFPATELRPQARFGQGWARENQSRLDEAMEAYREVVKDHMGPTAARAQFQLGECLFAKKQYEEAVRELLKVDILFAYPEWSAAALFEAGRCFEQLNKSAEARSQYKLVMDEHADTKWAELARQRLASQAGGGLPGAK